MPLQIQENSEDLNKILPTLRQDVQLMEGPPEPDGSPTYSLYDPVRASYFKISWAEAVVFENLKSNMKMADLVQAIKKRSTLQVTPESLNAFFLDAERLGLLSLGHESEEYIKEAEARKQGWFMWLIMHYLYIQIPLFRPDNFLTKTVKYVRPLFSKWAIAFYAVLLLSGLVLLISRFHEYINTFTYFFTFGGFIAYALAISLVKVIHEFAHAYVSKSVGIRVRQMGVALIVFWPVLYTDVTDSWRLSSRLQRFKISFAGIAAELVIASIATWGWILTDPGILNSIFFVISSVTWISTLAVNLNPSMRFDGYYLLCDLWGIDNLQWRAFAYTRWFYRKWLLGIDMPMPEPLSTKRQVGFLVYSIVTWIWRLSLYIFVAVFVYYKFTKTLGIFLFILEIAIFILWPLWGEICQVWKLKELIHLNKRLLATLSVLALFLAWFTIPLPHSQTFVAITAPREEQQVYAPYDGVMQKIYVARDQVVQPGDKLFEMTSFPLENRIKILKEDKAMKEREVILAQMNPQDRALIKEKTAALRQSESELKALQSLKQNLTLYAEIGGVIYQYDEYIHEGQPVKKDTVLARISPLNKASVDAFVPETDVKNLKVGQEVTFFTHNYRESYKGVISSIIPSRDQVLSYPQLSSLHGGELPTTQESETNRLLLVESYYQVEVDIDNNPPYRIGMTGYIEVRGERISYLGHLLNYLTRIFYRESTL